MEKFRFIFFIFLLLPINADAKELKVACAANFISPMKAISSSFEREKGVKIISTFGATGLIFSQIKKGAAFDVFLAADLKRPKLLVEENLGEYSFIYARGRIVLWSKNKRITSSKNYYEALMNSKNISIAFPKSAPYGQAAVEFLKKKKIYDLFKDRLVYGKNVSQAFSYGYSGFSDSCFSALSHALSKKGKEGKIFYLDNSSEIIQGGCVLNKTPLSEEFVNYLKNSKEVLHRFGYSI